MNDSDRNTLLIVQEMMNDYRIIRNSDRNYARLTPLDTVARHKNTLKFIKSVVDSNPNKKYVVIGHHAPSKKSIKPRYEEDVEVNGAYSSNLEDFISARPQIILWTHGHMHSYHDYMVGNTRIVCNPRGYIGYESQAEEFTLKYVEV
jgi:Icc-related predicted phosphoesterase